MSERETTTPELWADGEFVHLGVAELLVLLAGAGDAANRAIAAVGISQEFLEEGVQLAGLSGLFLRGYLEMNEDTGAPVPTLEAAALVFAAQRATRWTTGALLDEDREPFATFAVAHALDAEIMLMEGPLNSWSFGPVNNEDGVPGIVANLFGGVLEERPTTTLFLLIDDGPEVDKRVLFARKHEDGYEIARGTGAEAKPPVDPHRYEDDGFENVLAELFNRTATD